MATLERSAPAAPHVHEEVLDNGLRVLIQEMHTAPLATVWCWYRVGSKDETAGQTGVSHWVEHMNFKGTTNIPRDKVKGIIEQFGGYWNGYTWIDQTTYTETATRDALDRMLFIESERMASCLYDPADCESERTVIISELQGGENDPDTLLDQELTAIAFKAHPYRHPTIGWLSDLETMTRDDLYGYYRRFYVPNNATLVIVGDIDMKEAMRGVVRHFGGITPGDVPRRRTTKEPEQLGERRLTLSREGTTSYLKIGYHAPAIGDAAFFPMLVLDAVLTGAKGINLWASFRTPPPQRSARLYRALVNTGLASSVAGGLVPTAEPFLYTISLTATAGTPLARLEEAVLTEIESVRAEGISRAELEKAVHQLRARLVFENDSISNIGHQLGYFETVASWRGLGSIQHQIESVTVDQVAAVAFDRLKAINRTVGWFEPSPVGSGAGPLGEGASAGPASAARQVTSGRS
jgi:zinc protease